MGCTSSKRCDECGAKHKFKQMFGNGFRTFETNVWETKKGRSADPENTAVVKTIGELPKELSKHPEREHHLRWADVPPEKWCNGIVFAKPQETDFHSQNRREPDIPCEKGGDPPSRYVTVIKRVCKDKAKCDWRKAKQRKLGLTLVRKSQEIEGFELVGTQAQQDFQERAAIKLDEAKHRASQDRAERRASSGARRLGMTSTPSPVTAVAPWILLPLGFVLYALGRRFFAKRAHRDPGATRSSMVELIQ